MEANSKVNEVSLQPVAEDDSCNVRATVKSFSGISEDNTRVMKGADLPINKWEWLLYPIKSAWQAIQITPLTMIAAVIISSVVIALSIFLLLIISNARKFLVASRDDVILSVYLVDTISEMQREDILNVFVTDDNVRSVHYRDKKEALEVFQHELGDYSAALEGFIDDNPLPASFEVEFHHASLDIDVLASYSERIGNMPGVELVQYDRTVLDLLNSVARKLGNFILVLSPLLFIVVGFVIWITSKLIIFSHRREIEVKRLVGASGWYVWSPFILDGMLIALLGAFFGLVSNYWCIYYLLEWLGRDTSLQLKFDFLPLSWILLITFSALCIGAFSSYMAARMHDIK
jgi:cell division transport system permease protein